MTIIDSTQTFHYATAIPFYQLHTLQSMYTKVLCMYSYMLCRTLKVICIIQYPFLQKKLSKIIHSGFLQEMAS